MPHDEQQILNADHALATLANTLGNNPNNPSDSYCFPPIDDDRAMVSHVRRELKRELKEAISLSLSLILFAHFCRFNSLYKLKQQRIHIYTYIYIYIYKFFQYFSSRSM